MLMQSGKLLFTILKCFCIIVTYIMHFPKSTIFSDFPNLKNQHFWHFFSLPMLGLKEMLKCFKCQKKDVSTDLGEKIFMQKNINSRLSLCLYFERNWVLLIQSIPESEVLKQINSTRKTFYWFFLKNYIIFTFTILVPVTKIFICNSCPSTVIILYKIYKDVNLFV